MLLLRRNFVFAKSYLLIRIACTLTFPLKIKLFGMNAGAVGTQFSLLTFHTCGRDCVMSYAN